MQVIPAIDVEGGRSRVVFWPGVSSGVGAPTDRPEQIAEHFVGLGAPVIHLVDFDGARRGSPVNTATLGAIASLVATPLQLAGGVDDPDAIRLAFAAGATRVVCSLVVADDPPRLDGCLAVAGDWLAVGLDARADRLATFPWRRGTAPSLTELVSELAGRGVRRFVLGHATGDPEIETLATLATTVDADLLVAGGTSDAAGIRRVRDAGAAGIILGEALLSGAIDYQTAREAAA
ncbi:MAG TPA: HisA/HisF-related TIM barrel protein [Candidatus Deferrimicrobiaceae bacterium]|nr:HisA/HisF-related TIM barrel protein [Candidatus Deferrimicrobiaceae bacterium]